MPRKKKRAKKAKKAPKKVPAPKPSPRPTPPPRHPRRFEPEPEPEPVEAKIRRYIELVSRRKLKEVAERPLPSTMSAAEIEDELRELLGDV